MSPETPGRNGDITVRKILASLAVVASLSGLALAGTTTAADAGGRAAQGRAVVVTDGRA